MNRTRLARLSLAIIFALNASPVWAATSTANATVSAQVPLRAELTLTRDTNSDTVGSPTQIIFQTPDDKDSGVAQPNANFMYAPIRSKTGKNYHLASIIANGSSMTLTADVTGTAGGKQLSQILSTFCGGFFTTGSSQPVAGTKSNDWEPLDTFQRSLNQPFSGIVPFNYRLDISTVGAGTYSGTVTFTLTSN